MSGYTPSRLSKYAFWQKNHVMKDISAEVNSQKWDYQPRKRVIFKSDSVVASASSKKERESLRQRREKVDCLTLAKEGMELMSFWAGCRPKQEQKSSRGREKAKEDLSLIQKEANTSFGISQLEKEVMRTLSLNQQQLSVRRKAHFRNSCQLESKGTSITEVKTTPIPTPRLRASSLTRPAPIRTQPMNRLPLLSENLTPWEAPDSPSLPF